MPATMTVKTEEYAQLHMKIGKCITFTLEGDAIVFARPFAMGDVIPLAEARGVWAGWGGSDEQFEECVSHMAALGKAS